MIEKGMDEEVLLFVIGGSVVMTLLGWMIGASRGRPGAGLMCGLLLGPLGVILSLFLPAGESPEVRKPGAPVKRARRIPVKQDPFEEFEEQERRK